MGSPDWMRRNLYRRIEAVTPVMDEELKQEMIDMLHIQLRDNQKAGWVDENLKNVLKRIRMKNRYAPNMHFMSI